jgi:hypothetical protein
MTDYSVLEIWYSPSTIKHAIQIAQQAMKYSRVKEDYFVDNAEEFEPHVWVVSAICKGLEVTQDHSDEMYKSGWQDGYDECIRQRC